MAGAQSATMMYAYWYTVALRAIVATLVLSASNLAAFSKDHWLQNPLDVVHLHLRSGVFRSL